MWAWIKNIQFGVLTVPRWIESAQLWDHCFPIMGSLNKELLPCPESSFCKTVVLYLECITSKYTFRLFTRPSNVQKGLNRDG